MGLTKQYLRYKPQAILNIVGSGRGGGIHVAKEHIAVAAVQNVILWDVRRKEKTLILYGDKHEVTALSTNSSGSLLSVGYADGTIKLFDVSTGESEVTFSGHKSAVNCLAFDKEGLRLVSGARDTTVIVWDVVAEAGLYRLQGHKGPVTSVAFLESQNVIVTSSKDSFVKFWDLQTQHCFKTLTGHLNEVWDFVLLNNDQYLVTGCSDSELRVWQLKFKGDVVASKGIEVDDQVPDVKREKSEEEKDKKLEEEGDNDDSSVLEISKLGSILRAGHGRLQSLVTDETGRLVACHGNDNAVELFLVCNEDEVKKRLAKKAKRERKRTGSELQQTEVKPTLQEQFRRLKSFKASGKVKSVSIKLKESEAQVGLVLGNNLVERFCVQLSEKEAECLPSGKIDTPGHRSDPRTVSFSSDNTAVLSASSESLKIWNRSSQVCIRTMECGYAVSSLFVPGDRHVIVGTKSGKLQIFDLRSGTMTEEVDAHEAEVWGCVLTSDRRGIVTGSADKTVKFWDFELLALENGKQLSIVHTRSLQLEEGVTGVAISPDGRLVAVSLLDSTVKVFFMDTLKFFLSLYGHKLPVLSMDICSDSTLIATASADRNIKVWGLDFGDCHKSLFAHDDSVTGLKFLPNTHMLFTSGKDGSVKQWDADNFQRIVTLQGHVGEVWCLAVSPNGKFVMTGGKDRTLRLWEKSSEVVVLDDERETERDEEAEQEAGDRQPVPGEESKEASLPSRRTAETERGAEQLMEAVQLYCEHEEQGEDATLPPLMLAYGADSALGYVAGVIGRIKSSQLEETLLVLPLDVVTQLMKLLAKLLEEGIELEITARCLLFLLEIHHGPIISNKMLEEVLAKLDSELSEKTDAYRDLIGTNLAGLRHLASKVEEAKNIQLFVDATQRVREKNKKKKKKEKLLARAVMSL